MRDDSSPGRIAWTAEGRYALTNASGGGRMENLVSRAVRNRPRKFRLLLRSGS
jgi:hypothetical protein